MDIFLSFHGCTVYTLASPSQCSLQDIGTGNWQLSAGHGLTRMVGQQKRKKKEGYCIFSSRIRADQMPGLSQEDQLM